MKTNRKHQKVLQAAYGRKVEELSLVIYRIEESLLLTDVTKVELTQEMKAFD